MPIGWAGLVGAKTFLQVHPEAKAVILDESATLGGTWALERLYPGLKSNNLLGTFEFPDFPMRPDDFPVRQGQHIPGEVCRYLEMHLEMNASAQCVGYSEAV